MTMLPSILTPYIPHVLEHVNKILVAWLLQEGKERTPSGVLPDRSLRPMIMTLTASRFQPVRPVPTEYLRGASSWKAKEAKSRSGIVEQLASTMRWVGHLTKSRIVLAACHDRCSMSLGLAL